MATDRREYYRQWRERKKAEAAAESSGAACSDNPEQTQLQEVAEQAVKKKRGLKPASLEANTTATADDISRAIANATRYIKAEPCKSDDEMAERINMYFEDCRTNGSIPKWETLALCLGITRSQAWNIASGKQGSAVRQRMMQRAKDILAAIDAELVATGKIPQVVYIFRAKNFYDMKDQQDVVVTPNNPLGDAATPEQLEAKYTTLIEIDGDEQQ